MRCFPSLAFLLYYILQKCQKSRFTTWASKSQNVDSRWLMFNVKISVIFHVFIQLGLVVCNIIESFKSSFKIVRFSFILLRWVVNFFSVILPNNFSDSVGHQQTGKNSTDSCCDVNEEFSTFDCQSLSAVTQSRRCWNEVKWPLTRTTVCGKWTVDRSLGLVLQCVTSNFFFDFRHAK